MEVYTDAMGTTHCRVNMDELMKITPPGYQPKVPKDSEIPWPKMGSFTWEMGPDSSWDLGWAHRLSQQFPSWAKLSAHCQQGPHGRDVCPPTPQRPKRAFENLMETYPWKYYGKNSHNLCPGCPLPDFHIDPDLWQGEVAALRKIWEQEEKLAKAEGAVQEEAAVLANANVTPVGGLDEMRPFGSVSSLPSTGARTEMRSVTKVTPVGGIPEMRGLGNWEALGKSTPETGPQTCQSMNSRSAEQATPIEAPIFNLWPHTTTPGSHGSSEHSAGFEHFKRRSSVDSATPPPLQLNLDSATKCTTSELSADPDFTDKSCRGLVEAVGSNFVSRFLESLPKPPSTSAAPPSLMTPIEGLPEMRQLSKTEFNNVAAATRQSLPNSELHVSLLTPMEGIPELQRICSANSGCKRQFIPPGCIKPLGCCPAVSAIEGIAELRNGAKKEDHGMPSSNELPLPGAVVEEISAETTNCRAALSPHIDEENSKGTTSCQAAPSPEIVEEILVGTAGCHAACPSKGRVRTAAALKADADGCIECPGLGDSRLQSHKGVSENPIPLMAPPQFVDAGVGCTPPTFQDRQVQKESADFAVTCTLASADSVQLAQRCVQGTHDLVKSGLGGNTLQSPKGTGESCIPQQVLPQFVDVGVGRTPPTFQDVQVQKESAACATKENSIPRSEDSMQLAQGCVCETHDLVTPAVSAAEVERMQEPLLGEIDVSRTLMCTEEVRPLKVLAMIQERRNMPTYVPPGVRPRRESWPSQETPLYVHNRQKIQSVDTEAPAMVGSEHLCVASAESEPHSDDLGIQGGVSAPASSPGGASLPFCSPSGAPPLACSSGSDASYHSPQPVGHGAVGISDADVGTAMDVAFGLNDVDSDRANWERVVDGSARMSCQRCHTPTETVDVGVGPSPPPTVEHRMSKRSRTTKEHQFINLKKRISERKSLIGGNFGTSLNSEGRRRSKRVTRPPLEYWRNEMKEYGRDHSSLPTVQGYVLRSPDMLWPCPGVPMKGKQKRRRNDAKL